MSKLTSVVIKTKEDFLKNNAEDADYNQYWYSPYTIDRMVEAITEVGGRVVNIIMNSNLII